MDNTRYRYLSPGEASIHFKVTENTLRNWANANKIKCEFTSGGHRRYMIPIVSEDGTKKKIIYCRSSNEENIESQARSLQETYPSYQVVSDIGSGVDFKRKGFLTILELLFEGDLNEVVTCTPDRFSRTGSRDLFRWMFEYFGAKLTFLCEDGKDSEEGLTSDLIEILRRIQTKDVK